MPVSPLRNRIGRIVLAAFGVAAIGAGALGVAGVHGTGLRLGAALAGVALVGHGLKLVRFARHGATSEVDRERQLR